MYKRILVPVDGSPTSRAGLDAAIDLALAGGGSLRLVHALDALRHASGYETCAACIHELLPLLRHQGEHLLDVDGLSAHADRNGLLDWVGALPRPPRHVYVTHGEPVAADALRQAIEERHRWPCAVPEYLDTTELSA